MAGSKKLYCFARIINGLPARCCCSANLNAICCKVNCLMTAQSLSRISKAVTTCSVLVVDDSLGRTAPEIQADVVCLSRQVGFWRSLKILQRESQRVNLAP